MNCSRNQGCIWLLQLCSPQIIEFLLKIINKNIINTIVLIVAYVCSCIFVYVFVSVICSSLNELLTLTGPAQR